MKIGFIGTGVITEAILLGLFNSDCAVERVFLSRRSETVSSRLAGQYTSVEVLDDNQAIVDQTEVVIFAVRPQVAEGVIRPLTFRSDQQVISLIATLTSEILLNWIGVQLSICRAIPLPFVADRIGVTVIYPSLPVTENLFQAVGTVMVAESLKEFDSYVVASASMGMFFEILDTLSGWLQNQGASQQNAQTYLSGLFSGLAHTALKHSNKSFTELKEGHCTPGGLNEQLARVFCQQGGPQALKKAMTNIQKRILEVTKAD